MRPLPRFFVVLVTLTTLAACGTKTPLSLPPQPQPATPGAVTPAPTSAVDHSNKAAAEPGR